MSSVSHLTPNWRPHLWIICFIVTTLIENTPHKVTKVTSVNVERARKKKYKENQPTHKTDFISKVIIDPSIGNTSEPVKSDSSEINIETMRFFLQPIELCVSHYFRGGTIIEAHKLCHKSSPQHFASRDEKKKKKLRFNENKRRKNGNKNGRGSERERSTRGQLTI